MALIELGGLRRGTLTIQASQTIASYWLPPFLVAFGAAYPDVGLVLHEGNSADVVRAVGDGTADLGFAEGDIDDAVLATVSVALDRMVVVGAANHPLARKRKVSPHDLAEASWILREMGSGTRSMFEAALRVQGIDPSTLSTVLEVLTNEAACVAVRVSTHLTVVSDLVALPHFEAGRLAPIAFDLESRIFILVRHRQSYQTKASKAFEGLVREAGSGRLDSA